MFDSLKAKNFDVLMLHHAEAILSHDMPDVASELEDVLDGLSIPVEELVKGGGGEGDMTQRLRRELNDTRGWKKHNFTVTKYVDNVRRESISHEIDHVKTLQAGTIALEIEWNNKDPFYDRDLENFKRLHADGVISIGGIITRGSSLQDSLRELIAAFAKKKGFTSLADLSEYYAPTGRQQKLIKKAAERFRSFEDGWAHAFVGDKFGEATTHWRKLFDRVNRGVGNPCPLLLIGIPRDVVTP